jgi:hypothetical protein
MNEDIDLINRDYTAIKERRFDDYDALFAPHVRLEGRDVRPAPVPTP